MSHIPQNINLQGKTYPCCLASWLTYPDSVNENTIMWYLEYQDAWPEIIDDYRHIPDDQPMIGHFLVMVNEKSIRIGCVIGYMFESTKQRNAAMMTCNYAMTNIKRTPVYNTCKVPASKCLTGTNPKYPYLCSENEVYDLGKKLKFEPYDGDGSETYNI
ncbi:hypothetical protein DOY81_010770 [Sarcophaga bullata]|nr:hypothetical protein DOY81_010770 [Sarcophaga bullata]